MSGRDGFELSPKTSFTIRDSGRALPGQHTPRQNRLLAALSGDEYERLLPCVQPVALPLGWIIHRAGDHEDFLYFLSSGIVSRFYMTASGDTARLAVTGREGAVGIASFLGGESMPNHAAVVSPGRLPSVPRIPASGSQPAVHANAFR